MDHGYSMFYIIFFYFLIPPFSEKHSHPPQHKNVFLSPDIPLVFGYGVPFIFK